MEYVLQESDQTLLIRLNFGKFGHICDAIPFNPICHSRNLVSGIQGWGATPSPKILDSRLQTRE